MRYTTPIRCNYEWDGGVVSIGDNQYRHTCHLCEKSLVVAGNDDGKPAQLRRSCVKVRLDPCVHLGKYTGKTAECKGCPSQKRKHSILECSLHGECLPLVVLHTTTDKNVKRYHSCQTCSDYDPDMSVVVQKEEMEPKLPQRKQKKEKF